MAFWLALLLLTGSRDRVAWASSLVLGLGVYDGGAVREPLGHRRLWDRGEGQVPGRRLIQQAALHEVIDVAPEAVAGRLAEVGGEAGGLEARGAAERQVGPLG